jgi:hypothetical protein
VNGVSLYRGGKFRGEVEAAWNGEEGDLCWNPCHRPGSRRKVPYRGGVEAPESGEAESWLEAAISNRLWGCWNQPSRSQRPMRHGEV